MLIEGNAVDAVMASAAIPPPSIGRRALVAIVRDVVAGKPLSYRMVDNGLARQQVYQNLGKESINVAGKATTATKVSRSSDSKRVTVWVVEGLPVPARILQQDDGKDSLDLVLKSVN